MPQPASLYPPEPEGLGQVRDEHGDDDYEDDDMMMMMVRFEAMAAIMEAAGRSRVNKRYSVDAEFDFGNIPEKFYGFHDDYKRYPDIYL